MIDLRKDVAEHFLGGLSDCQKQQALITGSVQCFITYLSTSVLTKDSSENNIPVLVQKKESVAGNTRLKARFVEEASEHASHGPHHEPLCVLQFRSCTFTPTWVDFVPAPENRGCAPISCSSRIIYRLWQQRFSHGRQMRPNIRAPNYEEEQRPELMMEDERQAHKRLATGIFRGDV